MPLTFIDLFAGLGGFHLALRKLKCECVFASEIREDLQKLYKINFPDTLIRGDITKIPLEEIPPHDILCAGFPCQPFSQAGMRMGFKDKERGNLFDNICEILDKRHPKYVLLENVSNLKGHDEGRTWNIIKKRLDELNYWVKEDILSPDQFITIPQHRRRIYIVCIRKDIGTLDHFVFPKGRKGTCDIHKIIDPKDTEITKLKPRTRYQLAIWQEFIDLTVKNNQEIPTFPIWAMEFGADYEFEQKAPYFQTVEELRGHKGKLGQLINGTSVSDCLNQLPNYSQKQPTKKGNMTDDICQVFPKWKIRYIQQNRDFYKKNKFWLDQWLKKVMKFENSHLKMEWNCGINASPVIEDKIVQFRASGIRIKLPTFSPALNLIGTQIPIFPWVELPEKILKDGEPRKGRYMSIREAAQLQGMQELKFGDESFKLSKPRTFEALGNAVNATIVKHIAQKLIEL